MDVQTGTRQVIVVGGGRVGRRTAADLADSGYMVTVIERDESKVEQIPDHTISRVIVGDGTDVDVFQDANPTMADVVASLTNDTRTNLAVCELAREVVPRARTLARICEDGEQAYAHLAYVDHIVYPAAAGAARATRRITMDRPGLVSTPQETDEVENE
jgi:trk system potassium uptake protein TrkA